MCYMLDATQTIKTKKNRAMSSLLAILCVAMALVGCANTPERKVVAAKKVVVVQKPQQPKQQRVVVNKPRKTMARKAKDEHHVEYDKKRMWYNRQWLAKQEAEERLRVQRMEYQRKYEQKLKEQEWEKKQARVRHEQQMRQRQQQVQQIQRAAPVATYASSNQQSHRRQQQQRQAQIEARQQQHNWRQDGSWQQVQAQSREAALIRQRAQRRYQQQQARTQARRVMRSVPRRPASNLVSQLSNAAIALTYRKVHYDGRYIPISYPMGDVPSNIGVCTDTLIRSYRRLGIDLQQLVHEDISRAFHLYPNLPKWGLTGPDTNIDHRRVHNLKVFFSRHGRRLPVTNNPADYRPGDIVTWHLGGDQEHIGLVVNRRSPVDPRRHMIVHNIAKGDRMEDILFKLPITGHYRYLPNRSRWLAAR